ncbi:hypothetical protein Goshw_009561, partial [Gossypium schwendimanii]|nr:hypothetical protein [Gossypium schwendimanii]
MSLPVGTVIRLLSEQGMAVASETSTTALKIWTISTCCVLAPIQETGVTIWQMVQNPAVLAVPALWTETVTYMITDDLVVGPLPTKSIITLLNKFNVKDVVKEKVIAVGINK